MMDFGFGKTSSFNQGLMNNTTMFNCFNLKQLKSCVKQTSNGPSEGWYTKHLG